MRPFYSTLTTFAFLFAFSFSNAQSADTVKYINVKKETDRVIITTIYLNPDNTFELTKMIGDGFLVENGGQIQGTWKKENDKLILLDIINNEKKIEEVKQIVTEGKFARLYLIENGKLKKGGKFETMTTK